MDSRALSPLIGFVLLLSIIMGFMSIMQSNAVPQWNKGAEAKHLDKVSYEVAKLSEAVSIAGSTGNPAKIVIDAGVKYPEYYILISPSKAAGSIDKRELWVKIGTENFTTHAIIYRPNYLYSSSPELIFEHSAIFRMEHSYLIVILIRVPSQEIKLRYTSSMQHSTPFPQQRTSTLSSTPFLMGVRQGFPEH